MISLVREEGVEHVQSGGTATADQIARLVRLQTSLGRPVEVPADLSSEAAAHQISELVQIFNAQAREARKRQAQ